MLSIAEFWQMVEDGDAEITDIKTVQDEEGNTIVDITAVLVQPINHIIVECSLIL